MILSELGRELLLLAFLVYQIAYPIPIPPPSPATIVLVAMAALIL
jgi:hypothetical protein